MATEVLAVGTTVGTQSGELTHVEGTAKTYVMKGSGTVRLMFKDSGGTLIPAGPMLSSAGTISHKLDADGVFRWERVDGNCGVQQG